MKLMWLDHVSWPLKITPRLNADSTKSILFPLIIISDRESNKHLDLEVSPVANFP